MPSINRFNVSYNSSRVQRAYRINNIETMKLNHKIQLLEKERMHRQRLTNQDIRLISLTLDYIQTCSGHSPEGLPPNCSVIPEEHAVEDKGPCFLYGERIVSRKKRRHLRPQSAMDKSSSKVNSETASTVSTMEITPRPQSSPAKRCTTFVTHLNKDRDDADSVFGGSASTSSKSSGNPPAARFKPAWLDEPMPEVSKIILRSASGSGKRNSIFERSDDFHGGGGSAALKTLTRSLRIKTQTDEQDKIRRESQINPDDIASMLRPSSPERERGSNITEIINKGPKATMSATAWKSHLTTNQSTPMASSMQRQFIMESKKEMNSSRTKVIQKRVDKFVSESSQI